jgi:hypothetical protein
MRFPWLRVSVNDNEVLGYMRAYRNSQGLKDTLKGYLIRIVDRIRLGLFELHGHYNILIANMYCTL